MSRERGGDEMLSGMVCAIMQMGYLMCQGEEAGSLEGLKRNEARKMKAREKEAVRKVAVLKSMGVNENPMLTIFNNESMRIVVSRDQVNEDEESDWPVANAASRNGNARSLPQGGGAGRSGRQATGAGRLENNDDSDSEASGAAVGAATSNRFNDATARRAARAELMSQSDMPPEEQYNLSILELYHVPKVTTKMLSKEIGSGISGTVLKVKLDGVEVAGKKFKKSSDSEFMHEVYLCARLRHPGIIGFRGYHHGRHKYLFMDLMLYSFSEHYINGPGTVRKVPLNVRVRWALQLATAIEFMHSQNIVHRDINTRNVLISPEQIFKLCDLTFAVSFETRLNMLRRTHQNINWTPKSIREDTPEKGQPIDNLLVCSGPSSINGQPRFVGTARYMAPEVRRKRCIDFEAADMWSLASTILEVLTGTKPFFTIVKEELVRDHVKFLFDQYIQRPDSDFIYLDPVSNLPSNVLHPFHFLDDDRLNIASIPGMPQSTESDKLLKRLRACLSFNPSFRPLASSLVDSLANFDAYLSSAAYQRSRSEASLDMLPTLSEWPTFFSTFPPTPLANLVAPSVRSSSRF